MDSLDLTPEELTNFARCRFERRVFASHPCLQSIEPSDEYGGRFWEPFRGQAYDPLQFELVDGGWDHEHCDVCHARIGDGDAYWSNGHEAGGHVDLCEECHPRVLALLPPA